MFISDDKRDMGINLAHLQFWQMDEMSGKPVLILYFPNQQPIHVVHPRPELLRRLPGLKLTLEQEGMKRGLRARGVE